VEPEQTTAERLLTNAATLFREKGYAGTTTRELSSLLGLKNASLYHHISGKEDLLFQLCMATLKHIAAAIEEVLDENGEPIELLEKLALRYTEVALNDRDRHATMLIEIRALSPDRRQQVISARDANVARFHDIVARAQAAGQIRTDIETKYLVLGLFNLLNWSIFWWRPDGDISASELAKILWSLFSSGAATP
jgi:AcrR family transcriptional regulator